jgi:hypothetical protein
VSNGDTLLINSYLNQSEQIQRKFIHGNKKTHKNNKVLWLKSFIKTTY